jgi:hypothetical protein
MRMPEGLLGKLKMLPKLAEMGAFFPKIVSKGPVPGSDQDDGFSLYDYPVLTCWPGDGGPFITLPMVFSRNPDTGKRNCGMYRMQVSTSAPPACTGRRTSRAPSIIAACCGRQKRAWTSRSPSVPIRRPCIRRFCRCRPIWTK